MNHNRRVLVLAILAGLPGVLLSMGFLWLGDFSARVQWTLTVLLMGTWLGFTFALRERVIRPIQTLSNMMAALREGDFSIRARVEPDANDPLSLAYFEVNALEEILREQRLGAVEASAMLRRVLEKIPLVVFAFDEHEALRLVNRAGERLLGQPAERLIGKSARELRLHDALSGPAPRTMEVSYPGGTGRWELRRSIARQEGDRLQLLVLSDLSRALREEERAAWRRIVRVLGHEINNSLAPIKSITGSLQNLIKRDPKPEDWDEDVNRGLEVIFGRAESLSRFMATYSKLARLPRPRLAPVHVEEWIRNVAALETRLDVQVAPGKDLTIQADRDQLDQVLINLLKNAVEASEMAGRVEVSWWRRNDVLEVCVDDEGPGIGESRNLFVPFYTTKPGGSGIGLVLSRQIAEGHGGSLTLENRPDGKGARARLALPIDPDEAVG